MFSIFNKPETLNPKPQPANPRRIGLAVLPSRAARQSVEVHGRPLGCIWVEGLGFRV